MAVENKFGKHCKKCKTRLVPAIASACFKELLSPFAVKPPTCFARKTDSRRDRCAATSTARRSRTTRCSATPKESRFAAAKPQRSPRPGGLSTGPSSGACVRVQPSTSARRVQSHRSPRGRCPPANAMALPTGSSRTVKLVKFQQACDQPKLRPCAWRFLAVIDEVAVRLIAFHPPIGLDICPSPQDDAGHDGFRPPEA